MPRRTLPRLAAFRVLAVSSLLALAGGCGTKEPAITGVVVTVTFPPGPNQLTFSVSTEDGVAIPTAPRPEQPGAALPSPQTVTIYLPDALAGKTATCDVGAAGDGDAVFLQGEGSAQLVLHKLVHVTVDLTLNRPDAATPDAGEDAPAGSDASDGGTPGSDAPRDLAPSDGPRPNGQACNTGGDCESMLCVSGVCCGSACGGFCETCALPGKEGTCMPKPAGTAVADCAKQPASSCSFDGTCDGSGGCRKYIAGVACKAASCVAASYVPASACDGQGTCVAGKAVDCTPYVCDTTSGAPACRADCRAGMADCVAPAVCNAASCGAKVKKPNGSGCVAAADCVSNVCADGVCCATACANRCTSCNQTGFEGMCRNVDAGKPDPHGVCKDAGATSCAQNGLCDGAGACTLYPATTVCAAASCAARLVRGLRHCDGKGACSTVADLDCLPYRCDTATTACFTSCTDNNQCSSAPKRTCVNMMCQ